MVLYCTVLILIILSLVLQCIALHCINFWWLNKIISLKKKLIWRWCRSFCSARWGSPWIRTAAAKQMRQCDEAPATDSSRNQDAVAFKVRWWEKKGKKKKGSRLNENGNFLKQLLFWLFLMCTRINRTLVIGLVNLSFTA